MYQKRLIDPHGKQCVAHSPIEENDLIYGAGYRIAPEPEPEPKAETGTVDLRKTRPSPNPAENATS